MLELIVLGTIPGTEFQIDFKHYVVAISALSAVWFMASLTFRVRQYKPTYSAATTRFLRA